ncbi:hypothetical protein N7451_005913 [Penicillium sp. IBT 35674x]|nr:hypothetical protein N7451_005913 [Penicillium sp. IBT 35674x]
MFALSGRTIWLWGKTDTGRYLDRLATPLRPERFGASLNLWAGVAVLSRRGINLSRVWRVAGTELTLHCSINTFSLGQVE